MARCARRDQGVTAPVPGLRPGRGAGAPRRPAPLGLALLVLLAGAASAQQPWEYSPYRVRVWIAFQPAAELPDALYASLAEAFQQQAEVRAGATWNVRAERCPAALAEGIAASQGRPFGRHD